MIDNSVGAEGQSGSGAPAWKKVVAKYQQPSVWRSTWQIVNSVAPYAALWYLMYLLQSVSVWLALPLAVLAGAQPGGAVHHCTAVPVRAPTAIALSQGRAARALLGLFDESRARPDGRGVGLGVRMEGLFAAAIDGDDGGGLRRRLALLYSTS